MNHERQVLITGGTSGIGGAITRAFATAGWRVLATGGTASEVQLFLKQLQPGPKAGEQSVQAVTLDVRDGAAVEQIVGSLSQLDAVINCAGVLRRGGREFDPGEFAQVLDINLTGTMRVCTAAKPLLAASRGCVVNLASMLTYFGSGAAPAYSASKGGVAQLTKSLAIAWGAEGIRVNALAPGWIETPLTRPLVDDPARHQAILARTPLGRWGQPEDVAGAALFLCSPAAAFITGVILPVDGGYLIA